MWLNLDSKSLVKCPCQYGLIFWIFWSFYMYIHFYNIILFVTLLSDLMIWFMVTIQIQKTELWFAIRFTIWKQWFVLIDFFDFWFLSFSRCFHLLKLLCYIIELVLSLADNFSCKNIIERLEYCQQKYFSWTFSVYLIIINFFAAGIFNMTWHFVLCLCSSARMFYLIHNLHIYYELVMICWLTLPFCCML